MTINMERYLLNKKELIESMLETVIDEKSMPKYLADAMYYSLLAGGKRLRPILLLTSYYAYNNENIEKTYKTALALEMIHTYSLVHDDLPAMDDDDYRRGKLTNHKKFDEATAILAGDALLTKSFDLIASDEHLTNDEKVFVIQLLSQASGPRGMVGGQVLDIEGENQSLTLQQLENIHELKTGKLIEFAILTGAYLANGLDNNRVHLETFSYYLGLIFQVQDDILDIIGDPEKLGKPVGSDEELDKSTYPHLLGLDGAKKQKEMYIKKAEKALRDAKADASYLMALMQYFSERDH